jgi:peptidyl-prolyl cis-trans isomerase SurA
MMLTELFLILSMSGAAAESGRVVDRVAAVVNGEVITLSELEDQANTDYKRIPPGATREAARAKAIREAFDAVVAEKLMEGQVSALQVEVTDAEIDNALEEIKHHNNLTDAQLDQALSAQGETRQSYRKMVKKQLESMRILNLKVKNRVKVSDEDLKNYYKNNPQLYVAEDEVKVRHIFLPLTEKGGAAEEAKQRALAEKLSARARAGEDFAKLARDHSQGPSAQEGGDLGFLRRGTLQADVDKAAFALKPGEVSTPVKTKFGYHVIKVEERRGGKPKAFEDVKEQIRDRLANEQVGTFQAQYVAELRKDAVIDVRVPELKQETVGDVKAKATPPTGAKP